MFEICVEHTFAAGHALRNYHGKCENVHGHNYRVQVAIEGPKLDENGLLHDFADLKQRLRDDQRISGSPVHQRSEAVRRDQSVGREHREVHLRRNSEGLEDGVDFVRTGVGNRHVVRDLPTVSLASAETLSFNGRKKRRSSA